MTTLAGWTFLMRNEIISNPSLWPIIKTIFWLVEWLNRPRKMSWSQPKELDVPHLNVSLRSIIIFPPWLHVSVYIYIYVQKGTLWRPHFYGVFEKVTEKHLWSVYHQMLIVLICFNSVWDMFNYLAWVMKINQTKVMCHSIFVLI